MSSAGSHCVIRIELTGSRVFEPFSCMTCLPKVSSHSSDESSESKSKSRTPERYRRRSRSGSESGRKKHRHSSHRKFSHSHAHSSHRLGLSLHLLYFYSLALRSREHFIIWKTVWTTLRGRHSWTLGSYSAICCSHSDRGYVFKRFNVSVHRMQAKSVSYRWISFQSVCIIYGINSLQS